MEKEAKFPSGENTGYGRQIHWKNLSQPLVMFPLTSSSWDRNCVYYSAESNKVVKL